MPHKNELGVQQVLNPSTETRLLKPVYWNPSTETRLLKPAHIDIGYGVATISRLLKMIGLFCKRAL